MSMEIHVLSDRRLGSIAEWQQAIDAEGIALRLSDTTPFDAVDGHLPSQRGDNRVGGFECYHDPAPEFLQNDSDVDFGRPWSCVLSFRWGGNFAACASAWVAAAAYAKAVDGVVFDPEEGDIHTPERALQNARDIEHDLPAIEAEFERWARERRDT